MNLRATRKVRETSGPTVLDVGDIPDGELLVRIGDEIVGTGIAPPQEIIFDVDGTNRQHWVRPAGHTMMSIEAIGSGAGGAGGLEAAAGNNKTGGGGGGSGGIGKYDGPALWDELWLFVGRGGGGGTGGTVPTDGSHGESSWVVTADSAYNDDIGVCKSGEISARGGQRGGAGTLGGGGSGETAPSANWGKYAGHGLRQHEAGQQGSASSHLSNANSVEPSDAIPLTGGAAGGGCNSTNTARAGGHINAATTTAQVPRGEAGTPGGNGSPGVTDADGNCWTGGSGGGASATGTGGNGGAGALGCGGGGGGAGADAGDGAAGGAGRIRIRSW